MRLMDEDALRRRGKIGLAGTPGLSVVGPVPGGVGLAGGVPGLSVVGGAVPPGGVGLAPMQAPIGRPPTDLAPVVPPSGPMPGEGPERGVAAAVQGLVTVDGLLRGSDAARPDMPDRETVRAGLSPMNRLRTSEGEVGRDTFKRRLADRIMGDAMRPHEAKRRDWEADRGAIRQGMVEQLGQPGMVLKPGEAGMMGGVMFDGPPPVIDPPRPDFTTVRPGETVLRDGVRVFESPPVVETPKPVFNLVGPDQTLVRDGQAVFSRTRPPDPEVPVRKLVNAQGQAYAEQVWDGKAGVWVTRPLSTQKTVPMTGAVEHDVSMVPERYREASPDERQALIQAVRVDLQKTGLDVDSEDGYAAVSAEAKRRWRRLFE